jgi:flavin-dependent dehydrogenase
VVGADGRNSGVARAVAAPATQAFPALACWYFSYWSGVPARGLEMYVRDARAIFAFPTNDELFAVFVAWPVAELPAVRADVEPQFLAALGVVPQLAERVRGGRREERFYGATQLPNFVRRPHGPGWALVGDAGCHKDPLMALGVCDALRDAELLAAALADGLSGRAPLDEALAGYERARDAATLPDFRENLDAARLQPPAPEVARLLSALHDRPDDARAFFLAREGMIPPATFFAEENLRRIVMAAGAPAG